MAGATDGPVLRIQTVLQLTFFDKKLKHSIQCNA